MDSNIWKVIGIVIGIFLAIHLLAMLFGINYVSIPEGHEAAYVQKPWFFGHGGISSEVDTTGSVYKAPSTKAYLFDMRPVMYTEQFDNLVTNDNNPIDFSAYIWLQLESGTSDDLLRNHGKPWKPGDRENPDSWYSRQVKEPSRTIVRDHSKPQTMFDMTTNKDTTDAIAEDVQTELQQYLDDIGLKAKVVKVMIGKALPDEKVLEATIETARQKQRKKTVEAAKEVEDARKLLENSRALADKEYINVFGKSIRVSEFIELKRLQIKERELDILEKRSDINVVWGSGTTVQPMVNIGKK